MKLYFHPFAVDFNDGRDKRLARLDWCVVDADNRMARGFSFNIILDDHEFDESIATNETGASFMRLSVTGHPVDQIITKFFKDVDVCKTMIAFDIPSAVALVSHEARELRLAAKNVITDRVSIKSLTDRTFDFANNGIHEMIHFHTVDFMVGTIDIESA